MSKWLKLDVEMDWSVVSTHVLLVEEHKPVNDVVTPIWYSSHTYKFKTRAYCFGYVNATYHTRRINLESYHHK